MSGTRRHSPSAELVRRSRAAAEAAARLVRTRQDRPADAGDLFVLPQAGDAPLEWAVLARHAQRPALVLVVPADTQPLAGSADLALPAGCPSGPLSLRCALGVW